MGICVIAWIKVDFSTVENFLMWFSGLEAVN